MDKPIKEMTISELESIGFKLFGTREQLISQVEQANRNIAMVQSELQSRDSEKTNAPVSKSVKKVDK